MSSDSATSFDGTVFERCDDPWLALYLVACLCDTRKDLAALFADARRTFPDWPEAWTAESPPTIYDVFCHMHPAFDAAFPPPAATTTEPVAFERLPYTHLPRVGSVELVGCARDIITTGATTATTEPGEKLTEKL